MTNVLNFKNVSFVRDGNVILDSVNWAVDSDQRWVILGPNGAGKTTLLKLVIGTLFPTTGAVTVLDEVLGSVDVFELRNRIGFASNASAARIPDEELVRDVVLTAAYSVEGRWNERYEEMDIRQAIRVLSEWDLDEIAQHQFGTLSDGERKRAIIARAVMTDPELLLLDEPAASLDLGAREKLIQLLAGFAQSPSSPAMIMVTHHVEEIPIGFTHMMLLQNGSVFAAGPITETLTAENLEAVYGMPFTLSQSDGRYSAFAQR